MRCADGLTASDCNSLYVRQHADTEYPARIDHVLLRDAEGRVQDRAIVYDGHLPGEAFELSDHHGVGVTLRIEGR